MKLTETNAWNNYAENKYAKPEWDNSSHAMLKRIPAAAIGSLGKDLILDIFKALGHDVQKATSTDHDTMIDGRKVELKCATDSGNKDYVVNQIRPAQDYEIIILLLIDPEGYRMFKGNKEDFLEPDQQPGLKLQHGGKQGKGNTLMLNIKDVPPAFTEILKVDYNAYKL